MTAAKRRALARQGLKPWQHPSKWHPSRWSAARYRHLTARLAQAGRTSEVEALARLMAQGVTG